MQANASSDALASQFLANHTRRAEQTLEAADVDRHEIVAVPFVPRRELLCDVDERVRGCRRLIRARRLVDARVEGLSDEIRGSGFGIRTITHSLMQPC